jgi:hypothetical protein
MVTHNRQRSRFAVPIAGIALLLGVFSGCSSTQDFSKEIVGTWITWHWYYNITDGDNGFYDDNGKLTWVFNADGTFAVKSADGKTGESGTLEWTSSNQADVYLVDGTAYSVECQFATSHEGVGHHEEIQLTRVEDTYTWTLEWVE